MPAGQLREDLKALPTQRWSRTWVSVNYLLWPRSESLCSDLGCLAGTESGTIHV